VDEYLESVPSAQGNVKVDRGAGPPGQGETLTRSQQRALEREGPDGAAAAKLADETGPGPQNKSRQAEEQDIALEGPYRAKSKASAVTAAFGGGAGGMGAALPILLGATALGGVAWVLWRRRTTVS
jgi:hypothetical protein